MYQTINKLVDTISQAVNKLGLATILIFIGLGLLTGHIPSPLSKAIELVVQRTWQNQIMLGGIYSFDYAECLNKAEADAGGINGLFHKFSKRCEVENDKVQRHLQSIGVTIPKQGGDS